jgi:hypothetical protein
MSKIKRRRLGQLLAVLLLIAACDSPTGPAPAIREYRVGEQVQFNVQFGSGLLCSATARDIRSGRVVTISERAIIVADVDNPASDFTDDEYRAYASAFDAQVWPTVTHHFGEPHELDYNQRAVIFFTRAVNELTPPGEDWYVGGVFAARDLFPPEGSGRLGACPGSNYANMLYMLVPDPNGEVNGNPRHKSSELHRTVNVLAHELQHLVNASRRLYGGRTSPTDWTEETWLNEGLSQVAEELMGYAVSDLAPRQNIDIWRIADSQSATQAMSLHFYDNFHNLGHYLQNPDTTSLYGADSRASRGATWQFLRYAADRRGGSESAFWRGLVDTGSSGLANLQGALGADPLAWIHDWLVSAYVDDLVPGVPPRFTQQSWNFRGLYPQLRRPDGMSYGHYPLRTRTLTDGAQTSFTLAAGTGAYLRFAVAAGDRAEVVMGTGGSSCRQNGPSHTLAVGAVVEIGNANATTFCVDGGPEGGEFTLVPFHAATAGAHPVAVRATGIMPPVDPDHAHGEATDPHMAEQHAAPGLGGRQYEWKVRFRDQERRELDALVPGAAVIDGEVLLAASQTEETLRLMLVRTR